MRDVVVAYEIPEAAIGGREYIQPVDTWLRRGAVALTNRQELVSESTDVETQRVLVELADRLEVSSSTLDIGLWVLGSQFARSEPEMDRALRDADLIKRLIEEEAIRSAERSAALRRLWLLVDPPR